MGSRNGLGPGRAAQRGGRLAEIEADRGASGASQVRSGSVSTPMWPGRGVFKLPMCGIYRRILTMSAPTR
jgi:hypothetical protein